MAKNQVPEKVPKYRFAVWNVWYKTVHLKVCKIVECEMLGIVCLRIKIALLEPVSPLNPKDKKWSKYDKFRKIKVLRDFFISLLGHPKDTKKPRLDRVPLLNRY